MENIARIFINGIIGEDTTLQGVISQFKAYKNPTSVEVIINSIGGYVQDGNDIHDFLKGLTVPVTTIAKEAFSIASVIFMAGSIRLVYNQGTPLMIHNPLVLGMTGNATELKEVTAELEAIEKQFIDFYSPLVDIPKDTIKALLKNETFMTAKEAVSMGFATGIKEPLKAVAFYHDNSKPENVNFMTKIEQRLTAIAAKLGIKSDHEPAEVVALQMADANGVIIDFYELEDGATPAKGDKARIDGVDADGPVVMPSGETFVFDKGALSEVQPAEDPAPADADPAPVDTEPAPAPVNAPVENKELETLLSAVESLMLKNEGLETELKRVKKLMGSADVDEDPKPKPVKSVAEMTALEKRRHFRNA